VQRSRKKKLYKDKEKKKQVKNDVLDDDYVVHNGNNG
jgi:hypothetical protein